MPVTGPLRPYAMMTIAGQTFCRHLLRLLLTLVDCLALSKQSSLIESQRDESMCRDQARKLSADFQRGSLNNTSGGVHQTVTVLSQNFCA